MRRLRDQERKSLWFSTRYSYIESLRAGRVKERNMRVKYFSHEADLCDEV